MVKLRYVTQTAYQVNSALSQHHMTFCQREEWWKCINVTWYSGGKTQWVCVWRARDVDWSELKKLINSRAPQHSNLSRDTKLSMIEVERWHAHTLWTHIQSLFQFIHQRRKEIITIELQGAHFIKSIIAGGRSCDVEDPQRMTWQELIPLPMKTRSRSKWVWDLSCKNVRLWLVSTNLRCELSHVHGPYGQIVPLSVLSHLQDVSHHCLCLPGETEKEKARGGEPGSLGSHFSF